MYFYVSNMKWGGFAKWIWVFCATELSDSNLDEESVIVLKRRNVQHENGRSDEDLWKSVTKYVPRLFESHSSTKRQNRADFIFDKKASILWENVESPSLKAILATEHQRLIYACTE
jgi:hypothetical protein